MSDPAWVILNGPSRLQFIDHQFPEVVIGCNWAWRDWPLTDCVCIDRKMVDAIDQHFGGAERPCQFWTKSWPNLSGHWQTFPAPGIDSGTMAVSLALKRAKQVRVIGADGIMGGDRSTAYHYDWERTPKTDRAQRLHRTALIKLIRENPGRIQVFCLNEDPEIPTFK